MDQRRDQDLREKALRVNLDEARYGTFAEIGAGQEVVRWFFRVGAAAGTVAKSISAYDMQVSDVIYGKAARYVSRERLEHMLEREQRLNVERLTQQRGATTAFFAFADTVAARSFRGDGECHGWMGIRFQAQPGDEDSQIVLHVRLLDPDNLSQQEALGALGVNLVYGASYLWTDPDALTASLADGLAAGRAELDLVDFSGARFGQVDNRVMNLKLVELGLANAVVFSPAGETRQAAEVLYKRPVLVQRGRFLPPTLVNVDMQECALRRFEETKPPGERDVVSLLEMTLSDLGEDGAIDLHEFVERVDVLAEADVTVLISNFPEYYRLAAYLANFTSERVGLVLGAMSLAWLLDEERYRDLDGGILEAAGRLFKQNVTLYVHPSLEPDGSLLTAERPGVPAALDALYAFLLQRGNIEGLQGAKRELLSIRSPDVLARIRSGDASWESMVSPRVAQRIKQLGAFGYGAPSERG